LTWTAPEACGRESCLVEPDDFGPPVEWAANDPDADRTRRAEAPLRSHEEGDRGEAVVRLRLDAPEAEAFMAASRGRRE
jgi:hypothetical protein